MMSSEEIKTEIDFVASKINQFIFDNFCGKPVNLYDASLHYIKSGGKRLRPFMTIKSCQLFGGNLNTSLPAACSVELIHNFTLVHDDIMDNDNLRHNVSTVHNQFGTPIAILSGDILFSKAFHTLTSIGKEAGINNDSLIQMVNLLSSACIDVCEGQAMDIQMSKDMEFSSKEKYLEMIEKKTAALFKVSCELGTLSSANYTQRDLTNLSNYGTKIGIAFQLIDDLIGIYGDSAHTGKFVGNDIREGKKTLPILLALENLSSLDKEYLLDVFGKKHIEDPEITRIVDKIAKIGIDKDVRQIADQYIIDAFDSLENYENSSPLLSLKNSAKYIVQRSL